MMQNFVCMCTFISVSYKKHKGKHLGVKAESVVVLCSLQYLFALTDSQIFLDISINRITIAVFLLQRLH